MAGPRLRFPITNEDDYKGTITFTALQEQDVSSDYLSRVASAVGGQPADPAGDLPGEETGSISGEDRVRFEGTGLGSAFDTVFGSSRFISSLGSVRMYLPPQMQFTDGIEYANVDLGAAGAAASSALRSGASGAGVVGAMLSGALPDLDSIVEGIRGSLGSETASLAALRTIGRISETASNVVSTTTGVTLNPNRRTTLRGVSIRNFVFTFNLIPTTSREAETIKEIINFFRSEMYPEDIEIGGIAVGYKFPSKFRISMQYDGRPIAHGILPCFLQNMNTVYNPNNMAFHKDGNFPETTISLTFMEERTLRKQDILGARNSDGVALGGDF